MATTPFTSGELELLTEALHRLLETKEEAHAAGRQVPSLQATYVERLAVRFKPGQHFTNADMHRVVWPQSPVQGWIGINQEHLAQIIDTMEDAGLLRPSFGPRGGEGWALTAPGNK